MPYSQDVNLGHLAFYVRTERDPAPTAAALRSLIQRLDPNLPVNNMRTLEEQVSNSMLNDRLVTGLSISLAFLAALLAALGLYGVLAYVVARRTREIGIRIALGGERADILRLVVGQGGRLTVVGSAIGIVAALVAIAMGGELALWCDGTRSADICRCRRAARDCLGRGLLYTGAACDACRSHGGLALRVGSYPCPCCGTSRAASDPYSERNRLMRS
jgi:hypothetical protein